MRNDSSVKTQHTAGPWSYTEDDPMTVGQGGLVRGPLGEWVADVTSIDDDISPIAAKANARLIAAAPRMADSLVKLIRLCNRIANENNPDVQEAREVMAAAYGVGGFNAVEDF